MAEDKHGSNKRLRVQKNKNFSTLTTEEATERAQGSQQLPEEIDFNKDFDAVYEDLMEDLNLMGDIKPIEEGPEADQVLRFADFCRLKKLIGKYSHPTMVPSLKKLIDARRRALINEDEPSYRSLAHLSSREEENFLQRVSDVIFEHFDLSKETFFGSWEYV